MPRRITTELGAPPKSTENYYTSISLPQDLYAYIKQEANAAERSVNSEIVFRLLSTRGKKFVVKVVEEV